MGKGEGAAALSPPHIEAYLRTLHGAEVRVASLAPLGQRTQEGLKAYGYGRPLRVRYELAGELRDVVIRTMSPDPFGHERRADRAAVMIGSFDTFGGIPRHIRPIDIGAVDAAGGLRSMAHGELFLVTEFVEGELYAHDLHVRAPEGAPAPRDLARARILAEYLVELHAEGRPPGDHRRCLRDTIGSGEGIFGLCDSYPADDPVATPERLCRLEQLAVGWRWRLRGAARRARRTHGDFHPFNLLFRDGPRGGDLSVLDASRGTSGEPADDVACMALNYLFFGLVARGRFDGAMRALWDTFWASYLDATQDRELLGMVPPYFAWRGLVVASPVWYPDVARSVRERLFTFIERLLEGAPFAPDRVDELLS